MFKQLLRCALRKSLRFYAFLSVLQPAMMQRMKPQLLQSIKEKRAISPYSAWLAGDFVVTAQLLDELPNLSAPYASLCCPGPQTPVFLTIEGLRSIH